MKVISFFSFLNNDSEREQWVSKQIKKIPPGESIIDIGAGEGRFKKFCVHLRYVSQDFGKYNGKGDKKALQTKVWDTAGIDIISDITKIPVSKNKFDNVLCTEVLEHVPNPEAAIAEMARILKKRGRLIITAPFASQTHFSPYFFQTGFSNFWYKEILPKYDLHIKKLEARGDYFNYLCQELMRTPFVVRQYSNFGLLSYFLFLIIIPTIIFIYLISKLTKGSSEQLCFGWQVVAKKI